MTSTDAAHDSMLALTRRVLRLHEAGSTDMAAAPMRQSLDAYVNPERWAHEVDKIFRELPLALALSVELPNVGDYRALHVAGVPVLMVRGGDGQARAYVNACRHRGAPVVEDGRGHQGKGRFLCPYHAWAYDDRGALVAMFGERTVGELERQDLGLLELPSAERSGFIWVALKPGCDFDIDAWLGDFRPRLDSLRLANWHLYCQREVEGPGWKVAWDGYLEGYHQQMVHPQTVGKNTIANLMAWDAYGPHQRIVFGRKSLPQLSGKPESAWDAQVHIRLIHSAFPNLSISGIVGGHCLVSQLYPLPDMARTLTVQTVLVEALPRTATERDAAEVFSQMALQAVRDEDYAIGRRIQAGLGAAREGFIFGRNEPSLQHYHQWVERIAQWEPQAADEKQAARNRSRQRGHGHAA